MDPADVAAPADDCKSWWVDLMETLFGLGYGVAPSEMRTSPSGDALITFAALEAKGCPIKRNQSSGVMQTAPEYLHTALVHSTEGGATLKAELGNGLTLLPSSSASGLSLLAASAWSTAYVVLVFPCCATSALHCTALQSALPPVSWHALCSPACFLFEVRLSCVCTFLCLTLFIFMSLLSSGFTVRASLRAAFNTLPSNWLSLQVKAS